MALSYVDVDGTLIIPSAPAKWDVAPSASGTSTTGVIVLVGEADTGPDFSSEDIVANCGYGPGQRSAVVAKYGSGRLVDAFIMATSPSKDSGVRGAPQRIFLVKTNKGLKANVTLTASYAKLVSKLEGALGNLINVKIATVSGGKVSVAVSRKADNISETFTIGNNVVLTLVNAAGTCTINATNLISAGAATNLNITLSAYKTINDLAAFINTITGWTATVTTMFGQLPPSALDRVTTLAVTGGGATIKKDAYEFITALNGSRLVSVDTTIFPTIGLPAVQNVFLANGTRGSTTDQNVTDALVQAQRINANFPVTLMSQDATADITAADTDSASTYTISGVNAALATHVGLCSQFKMRRPRQGFASISATYANQKLAAQTMAAYRMSMSFLMPLVAGLTGTLTWYQPWAGAVIAASMQAAAGYRPMFNKALNVYGSKSPQGDFTVEDPTMVEDAILNGLLVLAPRDSDSALCFVSDQTTYGADNNFVLNSISTIYNADTISQTVSQKMDKAFKGQSFADVSAGVAMSYLKAVMSEIRKLKLVVPSDDAPTGMRNAKIDIQPPAMLVSAEVKPASGIYWIPIKFLLTQATQSAAG